MKGVALVALLSILYVLTFLAVIVAIAVLVVNNLLPPSWLWLVRWAVSIPFAVVYGWFVHGLLVRWTISLVRKGVRRNGK